MELGHESNRPLPRDLYELLHQGKWWVDAGNEWVKIDSDFSLEELETLHAYLCAHAGRFASWVAWRLRNANPTSGLPPILFPNDEWEEAFLAERKTDLWFSQLELVKAVKFRRDQLRLQEEKSIATLKRLREELTGSSS